MQRNGDDPVNRVLKARGVELLGAVARDLAHPVATYYRTLRAEGLDVDDARHLAVDFARKLLDDIVQRST